MFRFPYFATLLMCHNVSEISEKTLLKKETAFIAKKKIEYGMRDP